jgi:hypothetical protein
MKFLWKIQPVDDAVVPYDTTITNLCQENHTIEADKDIVTHLTGAVYD